MADLAEMQRTIAEAAERVGPAVVGLGRGWALGSGVVIEPGRCSPAPTGCAARR